MIDDTHAPGRRSWVASANGHAEFPIQNLPLGVFSAARRRKRAAASQSETTSLISPLRSSSACSSGLAAEAARAACGATLNPLFALGRESAARTAAARGDILDADGTDRAAIEALQRAAPSSRRGLSSSRCRPGRRLHRFLCRHSSRHQCRQTVRARTIRSCRTTNMCPIGYHGRASSIRSSRARRCAVRMGSASPRPSRPELRPLAQSRLRARARSVDRPRQ